MRRTLAKQDLNAPGFRADLYRILNPDLRHSTLDLERHYKRHGRKEGRRTYPDRIVQPGARRLDPALPNLVISTPDAGYGASTTALAVAEYFSNSHNVTVVFAKDGHQREKFEPLCVEMWVCSQILEDFYEAEAVAHLIAEDVRPRAVIVNSVSSWPIVPHLAKRFVATLSLVHEFADYVRPNFVFHNVALWSTRVVFPAHSVLERAKQLAPRALVRQCDVIPQAVPTNGTSEPDTTASKHDKNKAFRIIGAGSVSYRKGVDLFIETCNQLKRSQPGKTWSFSWIGPGFDPDEDLAYSAYLASQVELSGLTEEFEFVGPVDDIQPLLQSADLFLLTSRLDPFPNVAIEAMRASVPVLCFDGASGVAELLVDGSLSEELVCDSFSGTAMAEKAISLLDHKNRLKIATKVRRLWEAKLTLESYGLALAGLLDEAEKQVSEEKHKAVVIEASDFIDMRPSHMLAPQNDTRFDAVVHYVRAEETRIDPFRPSPSFSPLAYEESIDSKGKLNRYFDFLAAGQPEGPWLVPVIGASLPEMARTKAIEVVVHIHVHYLDVFETIMSRLSRQLENFQLVVSVTSPSLAAGVTEIITRQGNPSTSVVLAPASGRNFGSLFDLARKSEWSDDTLVCHLHTKKSPQFEDEGIGQGWMTFLLDNLLGTDNYTAADSIIRTFQRDEKLGLVFPVDPLLVAEGGNQAILTEMVRVFGLEGKAIPADFPVGGMFWARGSVVKQVANRFASLEFEKEPLAIDGTKAHAIERLLPRAVASEGARWALVFNPNSRRE